MKKKLVFSGSGGQGILMMAKLVSLGAIRNNMNAVMSQTYGIEQRGGDSTGYVVISDQPIGSPIVENDADICVVMSKSMLEPNLETIKPAGTMLLNSSMIHEMPTRKDIKYIQIAATDLAHQIGDRNCANILMLGYLLAAIKIIPPQTVIEALKEMMSENKQSLLDTNLKAFELGMTQAKGVQ